MPHAHRTPRAQGLMALGAGSLLLIGGIVGCNAVSDDDAVPMVSSVGSEQAQSLTATAASSSSASLPDGIDDDGPATETAVATSSQGTPVTGGDSGSQSGAQTSAAQSPTATPELATEVAPNPPADPLTPVAAPVAAPSRILLPTLGIDAPIVSVGVESDGLMEIPEDVSTVGWYRYGPGPGDPSGSAVLTGHVNDRDQGLGAFARIGDLNPGDTLQVVDSVGTTRTYSVIARESWPKPEVPLDRLFDRGGEPRLVLITCGGIFDRSSGNYEDNIAVTAVPVAP